MNGHREKSTPWVALKRLFRWLMHSRDSNETTVALERTRPLRSREGAYYDQAGLFLYAASLCIRIVVLLASTTRFFAVTVPKECVECIGWLASRLLLTRAARIAADSDMIYSECLSHCTTEYPGIGSISIRKYFSKRKNDRE
jgi:hypothetical protein